MQTSLSQFVVPRKCEIPAGAYGVFQVPEYNIMIPLYQANNANAQKIIDDPNSATIRPWGVGRIIEDHLDSISMNGKGVWNVSDFRPDTVAFIVTEKVTFCYASKFLCRAVRHTTCYTCDNQYLYPRSSTDICTISCVDATAKDVYFAIWRYTGNIKT